MKVVVKSNVNARSYDEAYLVTTVPSTDEDWRKLVGKGLSETFVKAEVTQEGLVTRETWSYTDDQVAEVVRRDGEIAEIGIYDWEEAYVVEKVFDWDE